jgi:hypothetical protein
VERSVYGGEYREIGYKIEELDLFLSYGTDSDTGTEA